MFPLKERHWITGNYERSISYDSWKQWLQFSIYKAWPYKLITWNIQDTDKANNNYTLQLLYSTVDGDIKIVSIFIHIKPDDQSQIESWLKQQVV